MNKICLVGVGALGIRHLEGLLRAAAALDITVVDPSQEALVNAQKTAEGHTVHHVSCSSEMPQGEIDLAIIATTARHLAGEPFSMHFNGGGQYGLMTNIMHYADYAAFLAGSSDFEVDTSMLGSEILESKRSGYKELQGSIALRYQNGSSALMTTLAHARVRRTTIASRHARAIFDEGENIAWIAEERNKWIWK